MARILQAMMVAFVSGLMLAPYVFAQPTTFITIGSGSTTGLYYPTSVGMAKIINEANIGIRANARSTGGSVYNAGAIQSGEQQLALAQNNIAYFAYHGTGITAFQDKATTELRSLAALYPEIIHILARKDANIGSPADLKGKRVYVGDVGSGTEQDTINILGAHGVTLDDLQSAVRGSAGSAVGLLRDGRIDAMFYTVGLGSAAIVEAAQTAPITVVPISSDKIAELHGEFAFYSGFTIPQGTYPGLDEDVSTVTMKAMLVASADLPEEAVHEVMNLLFKDKLDTFYNDVPNPNLKKYFKVEEALEGVPIPLHPGALKFYQEAGVQVAEDLMPPKS